MGPVRSIIQALAWRGGKQSLAARQAYNALGETLSLPLEELQCFYNREETSSWPFLVLGVLY